MAKVIGQGHITLTKIDESFQVKLTNEVVPIPCSSNGTPTSGAYAGASTTVEIFRGAVKLPVNEVSITALTNSSGVTSTKSNNKVTITGVPSGTSVVAGYVDISVSAITSGGTKILGVYRFNYVKQLQGNQGGQGIPGVPGQPGADGITYYTWIRYADNASGGGISDSPNGKAYIGLAHNKTTSTESNVPGDYSWSLIKGSDGRPGVPGTPGTDGKPGTTYYTWIRYSANSNGSGMTPTPQSNTKYIGIAVNKTSSTPSNVTTDYTWSLFRGADGGQGPSGTSYTLAIVGGVRGIAYDAVGTGPTPSGNTTYSIEFYENTTKITSGLSYSWNCGGALTKPSALTNSTLVATIKSVYQTADSFVSIAITYKGKVFNQSIPIICTKHASGLDWINDWNGNQVVVGGNKLISPRIFAGTNSNGATGVAIGVDALTGSKRIGLVGYQRNIPKFLLDVDGSLLISANASNGATDIVNGTQNGIYFDGDNLHISGNVFIRGGSVPSDVLPGEVVNGATDGTTANSLAQEWVSTNGTFINGAMIQTKTINANDLNLKGQLSIMNDEQIPTFIVDNEGNVELNGWLHSTNYVEGKSLGYSINRDGEAIFNQVTVRGNVMLKTAGITNYGDQLGNENLIRGTDREIKFSLPSGSATEGGVTKPLDTAIQAGEAVTVSLNVRGVANLNIYWIMAGGNASQSLISKSEITTGSYTSKTISYVVPTGRRLDSVYVCTQYNNSTPGSDYFEIEPFTFKVETGNQKTPWCPSKNDNSSKNPVRFWAGKDYSNRNDAPFKVYNDGSVVANKGTWKGTVTGDLHVGKVHIHRDELTLAREDVIIDEVTGTVAEGNYSVNPYFQANPSKTTINTSLSIGEDISYAVATRRFNLYNQYFKLESFKHENPQSTSMGTTNLEFDPSGGTGNHSGLNIYDWGQQRHNIKLKPGGQALFFTNYTTKKGTRDSDYVFSRGDGSKNAVVEVVGSIKTKAIMSPDHAIEMRSVVSTTNPDVESGFGFYLV